MNRIAYLIACFCIISAASYAAEIDYINCQSIQDAITMETSEIAKTSYSDHDELAQLYVSRGESYLLDGQYENAIGDFLKANSQIIFSHNANIVEIVAFRVAFGSVVGYDNLGMQEETEHSLQQLQSIVNHISCGGCLEQRPCQEKLSPSTNTFHFQDMVKPSIDNMRQHRMIITCGQENNDNYADIQGPDRPPTSQWCEEVVTGVGRSMDAIACLAPNYAVKIALIGVIEALMTRAIKCCQAGGFWKACVAPIARKWREWNANKKRHILPNNYNLPLYINGTL